MAHCSAGKDGTSSCDTSPGEFLPVSLNPDPSESPLMLVFSSPLYRRTSQGIQCGRNKKGHAGKVLSQVPHIHSNSSVKNRSFYSKMEAPTMQPFPRNSLGKLSANALRQKSAHFLNSQQL